MPTGSRSGLLKCFVRREAATARGTSPGRRVFMFLGKDPFNLTKARFLLAAVARGRHEVCIYLNSNCEGAPCARLTSNFMCNAYSMTLENGMSYLLEPPAVHAAQIAAHPQPSGAAVSVEGATSATTSRSAAATGAIPPSSDLRDEDLSVLDGENENGSIAGDAQGASSASNLLPQELLGLKYRARIRGLMQPRRMEAILPNPEKLTCRGTLPWLQYGSGGRPRGPPGTDVGGKNQSSGGSIIEPSGSSVGQNRVTRRPSLSTISSVAALEAVPSDIEGDNGSSSDGYSRSSSAGDAGASGSGTTSTTTTSPLAPLQIPSGESSAHVADTGERGSRGLYNSPGTSMGSYSNYTSPTTSPDSPPFLGEASRGGGPGCSIGAVNAQGDGDQHQTGASPGGSTAAAAAAHAGAPSPGVSWRRALNGSFRLFRRPQVAADPSPLDEQTTIMPVNLRNKDPHWNEALRCWCLNFRGRVKMASVKNFQLVKDNDEDARPVMQFGKVERHSFILDFNPTGKLLSWLLI